MQGRGGPRSQEEEVVAEWVAKKEKEQQGEQKQEKQEQVWDGEGYVPREVCVGEGAGSGSGSWEKH